MYKEKLLLVLYMCSVCKALFTLARYQFWSGKTKTTHGEESISGEEEEKKYLNIFYRETLLCILNIYTIYFFYILIFNVNGQTSEMPQHMLFECNFIGKFTNYLTLIIRYFNFYCLKLLFDVKILCNFASHRQNKGSNAHTFSLCSQFGRRYTFFFIFYLIHVFFLSCVSPLNQEHNVVCLFRSRCAIERYSFVDKIFIFF
jgi:hypothetical protein